MPLYRGGQRIAKLYRGAAPIARAFRGSAEIFAPPPASAAVAALPQYFNYSNADLATYTWADVPLGSAAPDRVIVCAFLKSGLQVNATVSANSIAGSAGAVQVQRNNGGSYAGAIVSRAVESGTSGTISVTWSGTGAGRCGLLVVSLYGASVSAVDTADIAQAAPAMLLDAPTGSAAVSAVMWSYSTANGVAAFAGLTKHDQGVQETIEFAAAYGEIAAADETFDAGATFSGNSGGLNNLVGLSAVFPHA